jgi:TolA-binding protein
MRNAKFLPWRWAAVVIAASLVLGLAGVAMAQIDVTRTRVTGSIKDVDGGVLPGVTIAVNSLQKPLGGS